MNFHRFAVRMKDELNRYLRCSGTGSITEVVVRDSMDWTAVADTELAALRVAYYWRQHGHDLKVEKGVGGRWLVVVQAEVS